MSSYFDKTTWIFLSALSINSTSLRTEIPPCLFFRLPFFPLLSRQGPFRRARFNVWWFLNSKLLLLLVSLLNAPLQGRELWFESKSSNQIKNKSSQVKLRFCGPEVYQQVAYTEDLQIQTGNLGRCLRSRLTFLSVHAISLEKVVLKSYWPLNTSPCS